MVENNIPNQRCLVAKIIWPKKAVLKKRHGHLIICNKFVGNFIGSGLRLRGKIEIWMNWNGKVRTIENMFNLKWMEEIDHWSNFYFEYSESGYEQLELRR